jgi:probable rRNA maturation factor|tara:strand:- start:1422 stop:1868 length:447 start_codon:yes stop_codon:yes gene_type:complete
MCTFAQICNMIEFHYQKVEAIESEVLFSVWLDKVAQSEGFTVGDLTYIFCNDDYLLELNKTYLKHDTLTDIITFDYVSGTVVSGDIFISVERLLENAEVFNDTFKNERLRVMAHGLLHLMGFNDKSTEDQSIMRKKENEKIKMFHVEQ